VDTGFLRLTMEFPELSLVFPVRNQSDHVAEVFYSHADAVDRLGVTYETIFVANACTDNTVEVIRELSGNHAVRLVELDAGGWGLAVTNGIRAAKGAIICYANYARTSSDDLYELLSTALTDKTRAYKASRTIRDSRLRKYGSALYNLECRVLFGLGQRDVNGTPKVFPRTFGKLLRLCQEDDLVDLEFLVQCKRFGYPVVELPVHSTRRHSGRSTTNLGSAIGLYLGAFRLFLMKLVARFPDEC